MKIKTLTISNFRSIGSLTLECRDGINVIAGINGAGKSTVLSALEIGLSWIKARLRLREGKGLHPEFTDIKHGSNFTSVKITLASPQEISWDIHRYAQLFRGVKIKSDLNQLTLFADSVIEEYNKAEGNINLPMFVKYSVNRSLINIPVHVHKKHLLDALSLYEGKLDEGSNLRSFFEWFREREDIEREEREELQSFEYEDKQLKAVRQAISIVLPEYGELKTRRKKPSGFELRKRGEVFRVEQLSDGEKCYLTLIGDIARRLAICNPTMDNPLLGQGIILIDELELHLHPKWQREAIEKLRAVFPNCQFFITTHSPHIIQNLNLHNKDTLLVLADGKRINVDSRYGQPIDDIFLEIFDLDSLCPVPVDNALKNVWTLLNKGIYEGEELTKALNNLKQLVTYHDPAFVNINLQIALNKKISDEKITKK